MPAVVQAQVQGLREKYLTMRLVKLTPSKTKLKLTTGSTLALNMPPKQMQCQPPLLALLAGADACVVADDIRMQFGFGHVAKQVQCQPPLLALLAGGDSGTEAYDIWVNFCFGHVAKQVQCQLPLLALRAGADACVVAYDIWVNLGFGHAAS